MGVREGTLELRIGIDGRRQGKDDSSLHLLYFFAFFTTKAKK